MRRIKTCLRLTGEDYPSLSCYWLGQGHECAGRTVAHQVQTSGSLSRLVRMFIQRFNNTFSCMKSFFSILPGSPLLIWKCIYFYFIDDSNTDVPQFLPLFPLLLSPCSTPGLQHTLVYAHGPCIYAHVFLGYFLPVPPPPHSEIRQSVPCLHVSGPISFLSLWCSLDFT